VLLAVFRRATTRTGMTTSAPILTQDSIDSAPDASSVAAPEGWREIRDNPDIQFDQFSMAPPEVREPGWFDDLLKFLGELFSSILGPVGGFMADSWWFLKWVLLGLLVLFVLYWLARSFGPLARMRREKAAASGAAGSEPEWQPTQEESLALLEDADRLAAKGRFDEATHLLLKRSVNQIAKAKPDWVDPSSTARELAALPALSDAARSAFRTIAERVERSLFALRSLDKADWEAAREAYSDFASISIGASGGSRT
jgi:hypothetical protein